MHRQTSYSAQIFGYILAGYAVAAGCSTHKIAVFILKRHGQSVNFRLDAKLPVAAERLIHALAEGFELVKGKHIAQALKRYPMMNGRKL